VNGAQLNQHAEDLSVAVVASPVDDRVYVTGRTDNRDTYFDLLVAAYDGDGTPEWVTSYDTSTPESPYVVDQAFGGLAEVSPDGTTLFVVGSGREGVALHAFGVRDASVQAQEGKLLWATLLESAPAEMEIAPDGSAIFLRDSEGISAYEQDTGGRIWGPDPLGITPRSLAVAPTGKRLFVTGRQTGSGNLAGDEAPDGADFGTVAVEASTGEVLWSARYDGSPSRINRTDIANAVAVAPDGQRIYVTGTSWLVTSAGFTAQIRSQVTLSYDAASGARRWASTYPEPVGGESEGRFVAASPLDGTVYVGTQLQYHNVLGIPTYNAEDWGLEAYEP